MAHTYHELKVMTVAQLREIAAGIQHEAVQGYTQMNKEHLLAAVCRALNIDMHEHRVAAGASKSNMKARIKQLKEQREGALQTHDKRQLKALRREMHDLKHKLHKQAQATAQS